MLCISKLCPFKSLKIYRLDHLVSISSSCLPIYQSIYLSVCPSVYPPFQPSIHPPSIPLVGTSQARCCMYWEEMGRQVCNGCPCSLKSQNGSKRGEEQLCFTWIPITNGGAGGLGPGCLGLFQLVTGSMSLTLGPSLMHKNFRPFNRKTGL